MQLHQLQREEIASALRARATMWRQQSSHEFKIGAGRSSKMMSDRAAECDILAGLILTADLVEITHHEDGGAVGGE